MPIRTTFLLKIRLPRLKNPWGCLMNDPRFTDRLSTSSNYDLAKPLSIGVKLAPRHPLSEERNAYAAWSIADRVIERIIGRVHGLVLNWPEARVPPTSVIIGSNKMQVGAGFSAQGPVSARFTRLSPGDQDRVLASLESSDQDLLRGGFEGLKALVFMGYYRDPRTWKILDYAGPMVSRPERGWWE